MAEEKQTAPEAVEVEIEDTLDEQPELPLEASSAETAKEPPDKQTSSEPTDDIANLKAQLEAARAQAADSERLRAERDRFANIAAAKAREAQSAQSNSLLDQYNLIDNSLRNAQREREHLRQAWKDAIETGYIDKAAEINDQMQDLAVRMRDMAEGKAEIEARAERQRQAAEAPQRQPVRQAPPANSFEAELSRLPLSDTSKKWLREHPECLTDPTKRAAITRFDAVAQDQGLVPDTPAYFAYIESRLGYRQASSDSRPAPRQTSYAAPVSHDATGSPRPNQVRLTAAQAQMADDLGMSRLEYWKNLQEVSKQSWSIHNKAKSQ